MFADKFTEPKGSLFFREKVPYKPYSPSYEIYAEIEQHRSQGLLLFLIYNNSSVCYISKRAKKPWNLGFGNRKEIAKKI